LKVIDATILFEEPVRIHGIARVELEILRFFVDEPDVKFINLNADSGPSFVSFDSLSERLSQILTNLENKSKTSSNSLFSSAVLMAKNLAQQLIARTPPNFRLLVVLPLGGLNHFFKAVVRVKNALQVTGVEFKEFARAERRFFNSQSKKQKLSQKHFHHLNPSGKARPLGALESLGASGSFLSAGLLFMRMDMSHLARLKRERGLRIVLLIHDLVPIKFPHLTFQDHREKYSRWFSDAIQIADSVVSYSDSTRDDIKTYAYETLFLESIDIRPIALGLDHLVQEVSCNPPISLLDGERFIVYVSTVERRKNHDVLYRAYEFAALRGNAAKLPRLVIVGGHGWGATSVITDLKFDPILTDNNGRRTVTFLEGVSDDQLVWLYKNAHFSVYPSLYEGWGLPVTESLLNGTAVLVSDKGPLVEASFGQAIVLPAKDAEAWAEAIIEYAQADKMEVEKPHHTVTWASMGRRLSTIMEG
jgi:glycosyltransferase involved in cell wall biosynthesis